MQTNIETAIMSPPTPSGIAGAIAPAMIRRRHVCIIQPVMKQYRLAFFSALERALAEHGIGLTVAYGTPWAREALRGDNVPLPPPLGHEVKSYYLFNWLLVIPVFRPWIRADLVIVEQANKNALNYLLHVVRALGLKRLAYWGHGRDMQALHDTWSERYKRRTLKAVDWWFAYTRGARDYVVGQGFDPERATAVENAVDTRAMRDEMLSVSEMEKSRARHGLGWGDNNLVGVYCGSLYSNKYVAQLITISDEIIAAVPDFRLLIIGGGPEAGLLAELAASRPWVRMVGPKFGREKSVLLALSSLWLNPGLVGLGVLDAFCAGLPVLTRKLGPHSPELEYIVDDLNGYVLLTEEWPTYTHLVIDLLRDRGRLERLQHGARESALRYSIETMVANFTNGVLACLARC